MNDANRNFVWLRLYFYVNIAFLLLLSYLCAHDQTYILVIKNFFLSNKLGGVNEIAFYIHHCTIL